MVQHGIRGRLEGNQLAVGLVLVGLVVGVLGSLGPPAAAVGPCVRVGSACFATVQAAIDAAQPGDTVQIPAGRFDGGAVVTKSIALVGAGARRSALVGGEHVLTIGTWQAPTEPTVTIRGLTLSGGRAHSSPE